jgi:hypothetical protein
MPSPAAVMRACFSFSSRRHHAQRDTQRPSPQILRQALATLSRPYRLGWQSWSQAGGIALPFRGSTTVFLPFPERAYCVWPRGRCAERHSRSELFRWPARQERMQLNRTGCSPAPADPHAAHPTARTPAAPCGSSPSSAALASSRGDPSRCVAPNSAGARGFGRPPAPCAPTWPFRRG